MKPRIDFDMFKAPVKENLSGGLLGEGVRHLIPNSNALRDVIDLVEQNSLVYWVTYGEWSMHDMLVSLLNITGPAHVLISTYAMSENPARILAQLKDAAMIQSLRVLLDNRVDTRTAGSFQLMMNMSDELALTETHAKVTVIKNEEFNIAVIGSANYTENKRLECGVITTVEAAVNMQFNWITKALKDGIK